MSTPYPGQSPEYDPHQGWGPPPEPPVVSGPPAPGGGQPPYSQGYPGSGYPPGPQPGAYPPGPQQPGGYPPGPQPGAYPPGPHGAYPPGPQQPPGRPDRRLLFIGGGALAVVLVLIVATMVLVLSPDDPEDAVEAYMDAAREGNAAAMTDLLCEQYRTVILRNGGLDDVAKDGYKLGQVKVIDVQESKRTAEVTVELTERKNGRSSTTTQVLILVKEDGEWRLCGNREAPGHD